MEGPISRSVVDRLPAAIKNLDEACQKVYICLRLRKPEDEIARQMNLPLEKVQEYTNTVRSKLISSGQIDLIEDPRFVSIHADDPDKEDMPITGSELDTDKRLIIKEFLSCLKETVNRLPEHQLRLLRLRYKYSLSAKDIAGFCKKMGFSLIPNKKVSDLKEQDIFYGLNVALKEVFKGLKSRCIESASFGIDNLKYIFEEIGI